MAKELTFKKERGSPFSHLALERGRLPALSAADWGAHERVLRLLSLVAENAPAAPSEEASELGAGETQLLITWPAHWQLTAEVRCSGPREGLAFEILEQSPRFVFLRLSLLSGNGQESLNWLYCYREVGLAACAQGPWQEVAALLERHRALASAQKLWVLPLQGWCAGVWADGWGAELGQGGSYFTVLPPGQPCRVLLQLGQEVGVESSFGSAAEVTQRFAAEQAYRQLSVLAALQSRGLEAGEGKAVGLGITQFSLREALAILLLRQAYPQQVFYLSSAEAFKEWPREWKHYANCVGLKWHARLLHELDLEKELGFLSPEHVLGLVQELNKVTQIFAGLLGFKGR